MQNEANELSDLTVSIARLTEIVTVFRESNFVSESHNKGDLYKAKLVDWTDVDRGLAYDDFRYDVGKVLAITYQYQVNGAILISSDVFFLGFCRL